MLKDMNQSTVRLLGLVATAGGIFLASFAMYTVVVRGTAEIGLASIPGAVAVCLAAIGISMLTWKRCLLIRGTHVVEVESVLGLERCRRFGISALAIMRVEQRRPKCYQLTYRDPANGKYWTFEAGNRPEPLNDFLDEARRRLIAR